MRRGRFARFGRALATLEALGRYAVAVVIAIAGWLYRGDGREALRFRKWIVILMNILRIASRGEALIHAHACSFTLVHIGRAHADGGHTGGRASCSSREAT